MLNWVYTYDQLAAKTYSGLLAERFDSQIVVSETCYVNVTEFTLYNAEEVS